MTDFTVMVEGTSYMFVTGPERREGRDPRRGRLRARSAARRVHTAGAAWRTSPPSDEAEALDHVRRLLGLPAAEQPGGPAAVADPTDPRDRMDPELDTIVPDEPSRPYDMHDVIRRIVDDGEFFELQPGWAAEHHHRVRAPRRPQRRDRRAAARRPRRRARHRRVGQGRPVRPDVRLLQRPARHLRRRAGVPAGRRPGARRDHPARREAAVRLLRGDRARRSRSSPARRTAAPTTS